MSNARYILENLTEDELLTQLAEEAAELAQAALKKRRAITGYNPTPVTKSEATDQLREEIDDVDCCLLLAMAKAAECENKKMTAQAVEYLDSRYPKLARWRARLEKARAEADHAL